MSTRALIDRLHDLHAINLSRADAHLLCGAVGIGRIKRLTLSDRDVVDDAALEALANNPAASRLETFTAGPTEHVTHLGLAHLASSPHLGQLLSLRFDGTPFDDRAPQALAQASGLGRLRRIELCGTEITDAGIAALARTTALPSLLDVAIKSPHLTVAAWEALVKEAPLAVARSFLASQSLAGSTVDMTPNQGLRGYAKHVGLKASSRLQRRELVEAILSHARGGLGN